MMRHPENVLEYLLGSRTRAVLIRMLVESPEDRVWLRQLCKTARTGMSQMHRELRFLSYMGLLKSNREGGVCFYSIDPTHVMYEPLRELARATAEIDAGRGVPPVEFFRRDPLR